MHMHKNSLVWRVFRNNFIIIFVSMTAIFGVICFLACMWQKSYTSHDESKAVEKYVLNINNAIENGIQKSKNVITWPYFMDSFTISGQGNYEILERTNNIKVFLDNVTSDNSADIFIYTQNMNLFRNRYIKDASDCAEYDAIKEKIRVSKTVCWDEAVQEDESGREYVRFYTDSAGDSEYLMEYHVYLPEVDGKYDIAVAGEGYEPKHNEIVKNINGVFCAVLSGDRTELHQRVIVTVLACIFFEALFMLLIMFINYKTMTRIFHGMMSLVSEMQRDKDNITRSYVTVSPDDAEEIAVIKKTVNSLLRDVREITEQHHAVEKEKRNMEIHMLRKQLDPHMLYNSMSVIKLKAEKNNDKETVYIVDSLIDYYRAVLNKGNNFISIRDEIKTVEKFIRINSIARGENIDFYYEISDELMDFHIPAMVIHTFVENSVVHGFCGSVSEYRIIIICCSERNHIKITIEDNGEGIPQKKIDEINRGSSDGYGINNALKRLRIAFGNNVNVKIESVPDRYTRVTIDFDLG